MKKIGRANADVKRLFTANVFNLVSGAANFMGCFLVSAASQRQASVLMGQFLDTHKVLSKHKELYFWVDPVIE